MFEWDNKWEEERCACKIYLAIRTGATEIMVDFLMCYDEDDKKLCSFVNAYKDMPAGTAI